MFCECCPLSVSCLDNRQHPAPCQALGGDWFLEGIDFSGLRLFQDRQTRTKIVQEPGSPVDYQNLGIESERIVVGAAIEQKATITQSGRITVYPEEGGAMKYQPDFTIAKDGLLAPKILEASLLKPWGRNNDNIAETIEMLDHKLKQIKTMTQAGLTKFMAVLLNEEVKILQKDSYRLIPIVAAATVDVAVPKIAAFRLALKKQQEAPVAQAGGKRFVSSCVWLTPEVPGKRLR